MTDQERIDKVLETIRQCWQKYPELRLCQLIQNCYGINDTYYIEDENLIETLEINYL